MSKQDKSTEDTVKAIRGKMDKLLSDAISYIPGTKEIVGVLPEKLRLAEEYKESIPNILFGEDGSREIDPSLTDDLAAHLHYVGGEITKAHLFSRGLEMGRLIESICIDGMGL